MTGCNFTSSGCNAPEGECPGTCLHRIDTTQMTRRTAAIKGRVEQRAPVVSPEPGRFAAAWGAYKAHRQHSRIDGLRHALRSWRSANCTTKERA